MDKTEAALQLIQQTFERGLTTGMFIGFVLAGLFVLYILYVMNKNVKFRKTLCHECRKKHKKHCGY